MNKPLDLPWRVQLHGPCRPGYPDWTSASVRSSKNVHVASVGNVDRYYEGSAPEHAKFIVRACNCHADLLAALEHMLGACDPTADREDDEHFDYAEAYIACDAARQAIAKARGQE